MVLGTLFGPKTPKSDQPEDSLDIKKDSLFSPEETEQSPKVNNTSIVYPFHDVKATSFPPPLSIDASVYTDAENQVEEQTDTATERSPVSNNIKNIKEDVKDDEKKENSLKKHGEETKPKISHDRLKEVINASIKEAVQIIAKQCRMKPNDEEKSSGKKPKETLAKAIWHTKEGVLGKSKHETRPRSTEEYFSNRSRLPKNAYKSNCPQEKRNIVRTCPNKLQDEITKCLCKKGPVCEDAKDKKHSKQASSGKTDNRRMTGNVNIYICSEATENPQLAYKQNKPQSCAESSSETTTEPSPVSSCKLVNCIRNKRQKYKEKDSFDFLQSTEESSDSNPFSCVSSNIGTNSESSGFIDICAQDTESTSTECRCKDDQVISDQSIGKSKFVICDKAERPCSTIYPKKVSLDSDSEGWSSKSVCSDSRETEPCNQANGDGWPFEPKFGYYTKSLKRDRDPGKDSCRICSKNDVCRCQSNARSKRRSYKSTDREQWSTCSCIVEEDEEDGVCVNVKDSPKSTVDLKPTGTQEGVTVDQKDTEKELEKIASAVKEDGAEKETIQEQKDDDLVAKPSSLISGKLIRPETLTLKLLLKQYGTPPAQSLEQKSIIPDLAKTTDTGLSTNDTPVAQTEEKKEPAYRKKFNLREQHRFMKHLTSEQFEKPREPIEETKQVDQAEEKKTEENENEKDTEQRMSLPGRLRTSIFKTLKRVAGKENYKISEKVSDNDADRETVNAEGNIDTDQPVKSEANLQETQKEKRISFAQKLDINKFFKRKDKTSVSDTNQIVPKKKGKKTSVTDAAANLDTESESKDDTKKGEEEKKEELPVEDAEAEQDNSKLLTDTTSSKPDLTLTPDTTVEGTDPTNSQELPKTSTTEVITKKSSPPEVQEESNDQKSTGDQEQKHIEFEKPKITDKEPPKVTETEVGTNVQKVSTCMCIRCARKKKSAISQNVSRESEPSYTVCTSENFGPEERIEGCKCNCCTLQTPQSCNRLTSYPKSCLKKERQFCRMETQENNCSVFQHDNRSWEECGCRRMIPCENCCRPRNECSCRPVTVCVTCCKSKNECICKAVCASRSVCGCLKSMVCLYCDHPRDRCLCRSPAQKCSCCEQPVDVCLCEDRKTFSEGRPVLTEPDNDRTMYVTAWKPREDVRRYFARNLEDHRRNSINECRCHEKLKSQNSDDLPYQRLSCFSDVMNELQQKMSESVCCTQCGKIPCCCNNIKVDEGIDERKIKYCVSPKTRRKVVAVCVEKPRSKSPTVCKCEPQTRTERQKKIVVCCLCKSLPCRCKRSKSRDKKPKMKCYYCKNSPCVCATARERGKPRLCRCADSPCRTKEKEIAPCGKTSTKPKNNEEKIICVR